MFGKIKISRHEKTIQSKLLTFRRKSYSPFVGFEHHRLFRIRLRYDNGSCSALFTRAGNVRAAVDMDFQVSKGVGEPFEYNEKLYIMG